MFGLTAAMGTPLCGQRPLNKMALQSSAAGAVRRAGRTLSAQSHHPRIIFSDIDGTIMHAICEHDECSTTWEDSWQKQEDAEILTAPPSSTGQVAAISTLTLHKIAALRSKSCKFAIITGARLSTLLMRLPYLPQADAFVCENGGRVFYPGSPFPTACPLTEDAGWRSAQDHGAGPVSQDGVAPAEREGPLWDLYRSLREDGWSLDAKGYTTSFRIKAKGDKSIAMLKEVTDACPPGLACSYNLGSADFYPNTSGKIGAARHLMAAWGAAPADCVFLCDDDNDMELAREVGKAFLPTMTSESVKRAVAERPEQFVCATKPGGVAGSEEMLDAVAAHYGLA